MTLQLDTGPLLTPLIPTVFGLGAGLGWLLTRWSLTVSELGSPEVKYFQFFLCEIFHFLFKIFNFFVKYFQVNVPVTFTNTNTPTITLTSNSNVAATNTNNDGDTSNQSGTNNNSNGGRRRRRRREVRLPDNLVRMILDSAVRQQST